MCRVGRWNWTPIGSGRNAMADKAMDVYLNDHLGGATLGCDLAEQIGDHAGDTPLADVIATLHAQIEEDRETLADLMERMGVTRKRASTALGASRDRTRSAARASGAARPAGASPRVGGLRPTAFTRWSPARRRAGRTSTEGVPRSSGSSGGSRTSGRSRRYGCAASRGSRSTPTSRSSPSWRVRSVERESCRSRLRSESRATRRRIRLRGTLLKRGPGVARVRGSRFCRTISRSGDFRAGAYALGVSFASRFAGPS